jgi:ubiquinone/menaquinone biosynthesis C-methylase UbiE
MKFGPGFHATPGRSVDPSAYEQYVGRWSRLFVPNVLAAAEVAGGDRVLDVASGPGQVAAMALSVLEGPRLVVGADISCDLLSAARARLQRAAFQPVAMDGHALAFRDASFDAVVCQLGLQFFADPARGIAEFRRVLRPGRCVAVCVISTPERAPMWGVLADALSRHLPDQRHVLYLSFALADAAHLERLFRQASFHDVRVERLVRRVSIDSFDEYWDPIASGTGSMPQAYLALPEPARREVREDVRARLSAFECDGRLVMSLEMLIASGRA